MVFSHGSGMVFQMQIARHQNAVPLTRDYQIDAENSVSVPSSMAAE